jgi:predicted DCC family thiol-disulfide oxidoreductase YuxK
VRFLIQLDRHQRLYFAPLQGVAAQAILPSEYNESIDTIVYRRVSPDGKTDLLIRSDAVLLALIDTGSMWRHLARLARGIPLSLRDWCYDRVAQGRKKFPNTTACKRPSRAEQARILP